MRRSLWLEITPHCDLRCVHCYNDWRSGPKSQYPDAVTYERLTERLGRLLEVVPFAFVALSGGEPLVYRRLPELVRFLSARGQFPIITTNGRLLTSRRLAALSEAGLQGLQVSLLGKRPVTHDELAGRTSWKQAVRALCLGLEYGLEVGATTVVTRSNAAELSQLVELLALIGVPVLVVNELHAVGSAAGKEDLQLSAPAFAAAVEQARVTADAAGVRVEVVGERRSAAKVPRGTAWTRWALAPDGELKVCQQARRGLGNVFELSDDDLRVIDQRLLSGKLAAFADSAEGCSCFAERLRAA